MCSSRARRILAPRFAAIAPTPTRHGRTKASASEFPTGHIVDGRRRGRRDPCSRRPSPRVSPCGVARRERVANTASALRSEQWVRLTWELIGTTLQCEPVLSPAARRREGASPLPTCARRGLRKENRAMATDDADDLVPFQEVRVIRSTAPALLCRIGEKSVWRPPGFVWMT